MTRVLIVEDDSDIRAMLARGLEAEGFSVGMAGCVGDALTAARDDAPAAVVLDITLPDGSGHDVCRSLREGGYPGPILFLSARDEVRDRAEGLALGADDYIVKPFVFDELVARLRTHLLRRKESDEPRTIVTAGKLTLDLNTRQMSFGDASARLTPREAELLAMLMDQANKPVSRGDIFDKLWASQGGLSLNVVDVYVGYLRSKMADFVRFGGPILVTVRGRGFMLDLRGQDYRH
ncbi:response regulator transcription factor [Methylobacterium oxalidis]|uniref:DNA-binding response regulator n=1 Tax=Methylobacterium oxalidis TaxID=944322 RepID=A0A512J7T2_9HYPH|nr:response regulator transcription factor [Methylobacterium oxalidis]GEP05972.1 DNA-binding response regulator [Methylobacterium oxalidis]GJE33912.1 Response regulator MprA [Methylobacterium oxalidis]GLS66965.1 DNA-binding response regulator [Methylobacterium oxalidis]